MRRTGGRWIAVLALGAVAAGCGPAEPASPDRSLPPPPTATRQVAADPWHAVVAVEVGGSGLTRGLGMVLDEGGHVVTGLSADVAAGQPATVTVAGGATLDAEVVGVDSRTGVTVVRVSDPTGLVPATLGDSHLVAAGDEVVVATGPAGPAAEPLSGTVRDPSVLVGAVSMIEIDVAPRGGGVVATDDGAALGLIVSSATGGREAGFALPVTLVARVADQLIAGEPPSHPYLGLVLEPGPGGAVVRQVVAGGPAEQAGLRPGDVVTALDGRVVEDPGDLVAVVQSLDVGREVAVAFTRDGAEREARVTAVAAPD